MGVYIKATDKSTEPNIRYYGLFGNVTVEPNSASDIDIDVIGADIIPPVVSNILPSGTNVPITTTIIIIFNYKTDESCLISTGDFYFRNEKPDGFFGWY